MIYKQAAYKRSVIKHLYFSGMLSCADLSELTRKSLPLTTKLVNELMDEGEIIEAGFADSTGGRRPQMYSLKPDLSYIVSVAMDQLITRIAILDMKNNFVCAVKKFDLKLADNPDALNQLTQHISNYINQSSIPREKITGIGIGMPGFVDVKKGINHSFLKTEAGKSIVKTIEKAVNIPVLLDNDSSLIALAELKFGASRDKRNVMVINVGWGVGLGIIINGELFRGENGFAGEFSHISLFSNNKLCSCGKSGCLETETSLVVIVENALRGLQEGKLSILKNLSLENKEESFNAILASALQGDKFSIELLSEAGYNIGRGVAILIHLLNPELIILSGRGAEAKKLWLSPIQQAIHEHCIPKIAENTDVIISSLGFDAELLGAAALVMENYHGLEMNLRFKQQYNEVA